MREICLDTETTGLDPASGHRVIEIGAIELINKIKSGNHFHIYLNPEREMPKEAFAIHGISGDFLRDKPKFKEVVNDFINFISGAKLVIHNAGFDLKFINYELRNCGIPIIKREIVIDSLEIARNKFPGAGNSLDALCKRFKIDATKRIKHGALLDAELLADIYLELMGGNQASIFDSANMNDNNSNQKNNLLKTAPNQKINQKSQLTSRKFVLSDEENKAHLEFITKNFKNNFWGY